MSHRFGEDAHLDVERGQELIEEFEMIQQAVVDEAREIASVQARAGVQLRPANVCDRAADAVEGVTTRISRRGAATTFRTPVAVGSVFHLSFQRNVVDVAPTLAVCDRCAMLSDNVFDVHFRFAEEIELPTAAGETQD